MSEYAGKNTPTLPTDSADRKSIPLARGCLDYFPSALSEVARLSKHGNDKHNPGEEMHHARDKSGDHADCIARHQLERGTLDDDGFLHEVKVAWRALAQLQESLERRGAPMARGARASREYIDTLRNSRLENAGVVDVQFAPNRIDERIAGDTPLAREIKNDYYHGSRFPVGTEVFCEGYQGTVVAPDDPDVDGYRIGSSEVPVRYHTRPDDTRIEYPFVDVDNEEELSFA
jgi:hypothetical protein